VAAPVQFHTRNITRYFRSIDAKTIAEGRQWYPKARELAEDLAGPYNASDATQWDYDVERAAAVIAVLSPQVRWDRNVEQARHAYSLSNGEWLGFTADQVRASWGQGLTDGAVKAFRILVHGEDPNDVVKGPKVRQFWHTIVNPSDPRAVVVDRHAFAVAAGRVLNDEELGKLTGRAGTYDAVSEMYRRAAKILSKELQHAGLLRYNKATFDSVPMGITPAETQSITWTAWRREHAVTWRANRRDELTTPQEN